MAAMHRTLSLIAAALICWGSAVPAAHAAPIRCGDDSPAPTGKGNEADLLDPIEAAALADPRTQLQSIAREAAKRSANMQADQLAALAADDDLQETRGARLPQVTLSGQAMRTGYKDTATTTTSTSQNNLTLGASGTVFDFGKQSRLTEWRSRLAEAARYSYMSTRERVVLEAVMTALERNRYRAQVRVYQQYAKKMSCLADALERIVAEDKGRASELIQARKSARQAEISRDDAIAQVRQIDARLRKILGDNIMPWANIGMALLQIPDLNEVLLAAETNPDLVQMRQQAQAADSYAEAIQAGNRPQVRWTVSRVAGNGDAGATVWQAGLTMNYTLFSGFSETAAARAAVNRAGSMHQREAEVKAQIQTQANVLFDAAQTSYVRAKRYADVIRDSDRLRNFTFEQWAQLGRRSLFDLMSTEAEHYQLRVAYINALQDGYLASAQLRSLGAGLVTWLVPDMQQQMPR